VRGSVSRTLAVTWLGLLALAFVVDVVLWQAFGWYSGIGRVVLASVAWATLITGWIVLRRRLYDRTG
jgi:hypothetical protein